MTYYIKLNDSLYYYYYCISYIHLISYFKLSFYCVYCRLFCTIIYYIIFNLALLDDGTDKCHSTIINKLKHYH